MSTNITAEFQNALPNGIGATVQKTGISKADVVVNTTPTATGGWNTATVTADVARSHVLGAADGVPPGTYEKVSTGVFRKVP
jgi:hypothetical protein